MTSQKRLDRNAFHVEMKKPKHISSFNMDPTDDVIQLGWSFLSQNETLAVSMHPTKRLIAVLTKQNFFKIFTFEGYFVTLVECFLNRNSQIYSSTDTASSILVLEDIIIIISFRGTTIYTDNEIEQSNGDPPIKRRFTCIRRRRYKSAVLKHSDENRCFYQKKIHESNPIHIFIPDQASFEEIQLFSIEQDTMVVIPRAEICDEVYRIYRMSISEGTIIAKYTIDKSPTVEGYPHCVSIDSTMHVYILTPFSSVIHILSPEGGSADIQVSGCEIKRFIISKKFEKIGKYRQLLASLSEKLSRISAPFRGTFEDN